ncbi:Hypothetical predicted protein [Octopus vulgaris]|uniref:Uncharacterized protein n=1 Tax=Octopus vulgaris TaxID=6645 RepID=A0AA36AX73_OCTVU|nr:Hypothetical predicted protein [Octopus vulgaris]
MNEESVHLMGNQMGISKENEMKQDTRYQNKCSITGESVNCSRFDSPALFPTLHIQNKRRKQLSGELAQMQLWNAITDGCLISYPVRTDGSAACMSFDIPALFRTFHMHNKRPSFDSPALFPTLHMQNKRLESPNGELAQMVERSLSMREVPGSIPGFSKDDIIDLINVFSTT